MVSVRNYRVHSAYFMINFYHGWEVSCCHESTVTRTPQIFSELLMSLQVVQTTMQCLRFVRMMLFTYIILYYYILLKRAQYLR